MIDLKSYFHDKYQGGQNFIENVILPIFGEDKYEDAYEEDVLENNPELTHMADTIGISLILRLGTINIPMNPTDVFDITVSNHVQMERNRVTIQQLVRRIMSTYSSAFMVFHYDDSERWDWRFTFCSKKGNNHESTDSKRYTFLLGPNQSCRTAAENFNKLAGKRGEIELDDIVKAFDVESLSKEFFEKYKMQYGRFVGHVIGKEYVDKGDGKGEWREKEGLTPSELFYGLHEDEKMVRDYVKKLLGRIVFLHFLQKKGWLGSTDEEWANGPSDFMHQLFENASADQQENFLDDILEPLFSCLDTPLNQRREIFDTKVDGLRSVRVPFLGGLFERTEEDKEISIFPSGLFADFFKFLSEYNFTIDENDPNDAQVGVDPEMLGRIFENLLEDNKDKGAFYTPKEIVQYMCRESLIAYLQTNVTDLPTREALRQFVTSHDVAVLGGRDSALAQNVSQCLKKVKICDPAIGSGAFPMGLLNELFLCRGAIEDFSNAADIKRHIIQQNIYGVDIEKGAVEIARLRFWLSLITDADKPDVLPNMDFKIMQGNSLLEQYKSFDLSHIMDTKIEILGGHQFNMFETQIDVIRAEVKDAIKRYYSEQNHDVRRTMRESIQLKIQQQIAIQGINVDISDIKDIAANDQFFLWHTWFSDVFEENKGFDIVIGNPPYKIIGETEKNLLSQKCYIMAGHVDLYEIFIQQGIDLLRTLGIMVYINPNTLFSNLNSKDLRKKIIADYGLRMIDNFKMDVFSEPTVHTCIMHYSKGEKFKEIAVRKGIESIEGLLQKEDFSLNVQDIEVTDNYTFDVTVDDTARSIFKKTSKFTKLGDLCYLRQCIKTGNDKVYVCKSEIPMSAPWKKTLRGKGIERYSIKEDDLYLKYGNWLARNWANTTFYERSKIAIREAGNRITACLDSENRYFLSSIFAIYPKEEYTENTLKYLLGVLNSRFATYYIRKIAFELTAGAFTKMRCNQLARLPIPMGDMLILQPVITLVDRILSTKELNPQADTSALEAEIDHLVYDLYGLTEDEIKIIEENR